MIPLYKPYMPSEFPELNNILQSGELSYGKWGRLFEKKLSEYIENDKILTTNSYNSAMLVVLATIGISIGDEIIASPMSCLASNQPFVTQGAKIIWADIDPNTGTLDPEDVRRKITSKTKAIFHNHFCGYLGYINEINSIGKENGIIVVDDAIEAFGSEYKGKKIGNVSTDVTVYSFQTVRLPNSIDGGGISFNNLELFEKAQKIRDYGIDRKYFRDSLGEISSEFDINLPGFGATLSDTNSYIGCLQMDSIGNLISTQCQNAKLWSNLIEDKCNNCSPFENRKNTLPNYWVFGIFADNKIEAINNFREIGYYASGVHLNNNNYSVFKNTDMLSGVLEFYNKFVAIPSGWWVNLDKIKI